MKFIREEYAHRARFRERFAREVEAARKVGGFHTALVVDADPNDDPPWMATAYIPGPSLHGAVTEHGPLGEQALRMLGAGLAEGLAAIHACGLVHRDLKPANVILASDGPRIIDFGIARTQDSGRMTETGAIVGTYAYMSPEQVNGHRATPASDVFALGAVLAFAATGRSPFDGETAAAILHRIASGPADLSGLAGLPEQRDLVAACLAKDPADRPALADVLTRLAGSWPSGDWLPPAVMDMIEPPSEDPLDPRHARPTDDPTPEPRPPRRRFRRAPLIAGLAAAAVVVAAVAVPMVLAGHTDEAAPPAPPQRAVPSTPSVRQTVRATPSARLTEQTKPRPRHVVVDDGRAFGTGGWSMFQVRVDPANTGVRLTRRLDSSVVGQSARIYVNGVQSGRWEPLDGALAKWADETVELPRQATRGRRVLLVKNAFELSTKDFNEFTYFVDERIGGQWRRADVVDVGPSHLAQEKAHHYRIAKKTWAGTRSFTYAS